MEAKQLSIQGHDLLYLLGNGNTLTDLGFHLGSTYSLVNQSPMMDYTIINNLNVIGEGNSNSNNNVLTMNLSDDLYGEFQ